MQDNAETTVHGQTLKTTAYALSDSYALTAATNADDVWTRLLTFANISRYKLLIIADQLCSLRIPLSPVRMFKIFSQKSLYNTW